MFHYASVVHFSTHILVLLPCAIPLSLHSICFLHCQLQIPHLFHLLPTDQILVLQWLTQHWLAHTDLPHPTLDLPTHPLTHVGLGISKSHIQLLASAPLGNNHTRAAVTKQCYLVSATDGKVTNHVSGVTLAHLHRPASVVDEPRANTAYGVCGPLYSGLPLQRQTTVCLCKDRQWSVFTKTDHCLSL